MTVWIGDPNEAVDATEEELELIREGQQAVARGEVLDARAFLEEPSFPAAPDSERSRC